MKKIFAVALVLILVLSLAACSDKEKEEEEDGVTLIGTSGGGSSSTETESEDEDKPESRIPPSAIYTITGEIKHRDVLEEGYYADYTIEIDFVKLEGNYPSGRYTGDVYIKLKVDAEDYIKNMLKDVPAGMAGVNFDLDAYGLRNDIAVHVQGLQEFEMEGGKWKSSYTKDDDGNEVVPGEGDYVSETSTSIPYKTSGTAGGWADSGGGKAQVGDFDLGSSGDGSCWIRLVIEPDSVWGDSFYTAPSGTRKVQIFINADGVEISGEGTLTRKANGESERQKEINRERLGEKHNVDETI